MLLCPPTLESTVSSHPISPLVQKGNQNVLLSNLSIGNLLPHTPQLTYHFLNLHQPLVNSILSPLNMTLVEGFIEKSLPKEPII